MTWRADYVLALDAAEEKAGFQGWVTVDNQSGAAYRDARLKLVAGDVHRAVPAPQAMLPQGAVRKSMLNEMVREEGLFEYHLYTLPRPTTLKENQTKQVELLDAPALRVAKDFVLRGDTSYYQSVWRPSQPRQKVQVFLKFKNSSAAGLGLPLPKGIVRVYKRDTSGSPQFIGEDNVDHTPKDEDVALELGNAFDIAAERRQVDFTKIADRVFEVGFEIKLRNHKEGPISVRVVEPVGGDWTMIQNSHPFKKTDAFTVEFAVPVAAGQETVLTYRVRVTY
jgi:hypothetical protein